jgi:hypothetical protein
MDTVTTGSKTGGENRLSPPGARHGPAVKMVKYISLLLCSFYPRPPLLLTIFAAIHHQIAH